MSQNNHSGKLPPNDNITLKKRPIRKTKKKNIVNYLTCATLDGLSAKTIEVEATFTKGLPGFSVVGLVSSDIQEAKERVKSALLTNDFVFPPLKITINLSPSDIKKSGTHFDLSIALLNALNKEEINEEGLFVFGELGLDGKVKSSSTLFPIILSLKEQGLLKRAIVPKVAMSHLSHITNVDFIAVETLSEAIKLLKNKEFKASTTQFNYKANKIEINNKTFYDSNDIESDFADVKGQTIAKRAALIAAAGMHNFMMEGNPGCGKSMIAKRLKDILPPLLELEMLSIAKHQFLDGTIPDFKAKRPMRSPHHTATSASIFGGGSHKARIGEVALAHNGILFFDELPHFSKNILEALREPLQDKRVNISRVNSKIEYEADLMFVAAMNPCPCGNALSKKKSCRCSEIEVKRYKNRLSDPFLDRIDLFVVMQEINMHDEMNYTSQELKVIVNTAFKAQMKRDQSNLNGKMKEEEIEKFCQLDSQAQKILFSAIERFALSHRSINSIKKVARTIADIEQTEQIEKKHLLEALSYRRR
ncbi:MAG: MG(2+) CHELATASE FAMILY PROTEIN / ComM-related protein [uncultured Sulfurovum sp.]|uniref:MG(2+) CHELATASE FAMILY PROTEIN / ComM-related protein n=1 Tax=uncultured Sulfurovum sp. TaxID=269237 RepID=A0A6S6S245_9BACT|nr:MAG: MG(2+) CHELATASE FAMILY PROTEIN / ComM-related protein [uncultured Sulfurovum sp.]